MDGLVEIVATGFVMFWVGVLVPSFRKARIAYWSPHQFLFENVADTGVHLRTDALTVQNIGRKEAEAVEVVLSNQPDHFQVSPALDYETTDTQDGNFVIRIPSLGPKEHFTVQVLSYTLTPALQNVRSGAGTAEAIDFQIQRVYPRWAQVLIGLFFFAGLGFSLYGLIRAIIFVSQGIGIG